MGQGMDERPAPDENLISPSRTDLVRRLKRVEGQVRGLQRMIEEGRSCSEVIMQLAALREALNKVGVAMIVRRVETCLREEVSSSPAEAAVRERDKRDPSGRLREAVQLFLKFS